MLFMTPSPMTRTASTATTPAFVNDNIDRCVIDALNEIGVELVLLRCAGYNNVDLKYAAGRIRVLRVPAYSPYAVAEHAMALILLLNRKIHKSYLRTRDYNFSINGLTGFDLHGKTAGIIGTGKIYARASEWISWHMTLTPRKNLRQRAQNM